MFQHRRLILLLCCLVCLGWLVSNPGKAQPVEPILIISPGNGSVVTAPIEMRVMVQPGAENLVRVSLVDGQGDLLARQVTRLNEAHLDALEWITQLAFEIPGESASALLSVTTLDLAQRPIAARTVELTLQGVGDVRISPNVSSDP
jgi:hypothetical protein